MIWVSLLPRGGALRLLLKLRRAFFGLNQPLQQGPSPPFLSPSSIGNFPSSAGASLSFFWFGDKSNLKGLLPVFSPFPPSLCSSRLGYSLSSSGKRKDDPFPIQCNKTGRRHAGTEFHLLLKVGADPSLFSQGGIITSSPGTSDGTTSHVSSASPSAMSTPSGGGGPRYNRLLAPPFLRLVLVTGFFLMWEVR